MTMVDRNGPADGAKPLTGAKVLLWVVGFFGVIFTANGIFIYLALGSFPGVVVESSYHAGQVYNQELEVAREQEERGWKVDANLQRNEDGHAVLRIEPRDKDGQVLTGLDFTAQLEHPAHQGEDVAISLQEVQSGVYEGTMEGLSGGNWELVMEARRGDERLFRSQNRLLLAD